MHLMEEYYTRMKSKIVKIMMKAKSDVPYYRETLKRFDPISFESYADFLGCPVLEKASVNSRKSDMLSESFPRENLVVQKTSGSSGIPLEIHLTRNERLISQHTLSKCRNEWFSDHLALRYIHFFGISDSQFSEFLEFDNSITVSSIDLSETKCVEYIEKLRGIRDIGWLFGAPSLIARFAEISQLHGLDLGFLSPKFAEITGELGLLEQREKIEEVFRCPTVNHYGSREVWPIAYQCKYGKLHVQENICFIEILNDGKPCPPSVVGEVHVTSLCRNAMPFIRYRLGDLASMSHIECACGKSGMYIEMFAGRRNEFIKLGNGKVYGPSIVYKIIKEIESCLPDQMIKQFKVIQISSCKFKMKIHATNLERERFERMFAMAFRESLCTDIEIDFEYIDDYMSNSGKMNYFSSSLV